MVESNKIRNTLRGPIQGSSEKFRFQIGTPSHLSFAFLLLLLEGFIERRGFTFNELREFQVEGIHLGLKSKGIFLIALTGAGKTLVAYSFLGKAIMDGYIGVYLVPHTQLLEQKARQLEEFG